MKLRLLYCFLLLLLVSCSKKRAVFVVAGQSNAMGLGNSLKSIVGTEPCFEYNVKLDSLIKVKDRTEQTYFNFQKAKTGSFIPALAYTYSKTSTSDVFIIQCAKGGSALNIKSEKNLKFKKKYNIEISAIIWSQGENDGEAIANGLLTKEEYESSLAELIANYRRKYGTNIPFIIIETGRNTGSLEYDNGYAIVRESQRKIAKEDQHTYIGYNQTINFVEKEWLKDVVHYNQEALNDIGKELALFINTIKINNTLDI